MIGVGSPDCLSVSNTRLLACTLLVPSAILSSAKAAPVLCTEQQACQLSDQLSSSQPACKGCCCCCCCNQRCACHVEHSLDPSWQECMSRQQGQLAHLQLRDNVI